jgi:aminodeoxyfutalosine deaminase
VLDGFEAGEHDFGITCQLVLDIVRGVPLEWAQPTDDLAVAYADRGVVALGLGGSESARPARAFESVFAQAVSSGLHSVPHAGEVCGTESVWDAINELAAERIGQRGPEHSRMPRAHWTRSTD